MNEAFQFGVPTFEALMNGHRKFRAIEKELRKEYSFRKTEVWFDCGDYNIAGRDGQRGLSYDLELSGRAKTESIIRWYVEIEFEYWSGKCIINSEAGFQGKYGPMPTREIEPREFETVSQLKEYLNEVLDDLFGDIQGDIDKGTQDDLAEMKRISEQVTSLNADKPRE